MKRKQIIIAIVTAILVTSCKNNVVVWTVSDVAGLVILGICLIVFIALFIYEKISEAIKKRWKRKK